MTKKVLRIYEIVEDGDMSADITSVPTNIQFLDNICMQLNFTGAPVGTFQVQGSLDYEQTQQGTVVNQGNWVNLVLDPVPVAAGAPDSILIDMNQLSFPYIRLFFDRTSGTGTLQAFIGGKEV